MLFIIDIICRQVERGFVSVYKLNTNNLNLTTRAKEPAVQWGLGVFVILNYANIGVSTEHLPVSTECMHLCCMMIYFTIQDGAG